MDQMDTGAPPSDAALDLPRGGCWRRWLATLIDCLVVMIPFQILAVVLFNLTAGMVQMDSGLYSFCAPAEKIPEFLNPPPPHDSNFARVCRFSFFGMPNGATLTVGRTTHEASATTTVSQGYMLDKDGTPISGAAIDWLVQLALLAYLVGMIWKTGRTVGGRILGLRVIDTTRPDTSKVPIHKAVIRYLAMAIGFVPMFAALAYQYAVTNHSADAMFTGDFFRWFAYAAVFGGLWAIVLIMQIAMKTDPFYDRLAGTAVVRV
jgi:RDD family